MTFGRPPGIPHENAGAMPPIPSETLCAPCCPPRSIPGRGPEPHHPTPDPTLPPPPPSPQPPAPTPPTLHLDAFRHCGVDDEAHVGLADAHPKRDGRGEDLRRRRGAGGGVAPTRGGRNNTGGPGAPPRPRRGAPEGRPPRGARPLRPVPGNPGCGPAARARAGAACLPAGRRGSSRRAPAAAPPAPCRRGSGPPRCPRPAARPTGARRPCWGRGRGGGGAPGGGAGGWRGLPGRGRAAAEPPRGRRSAPRPAGRERGALGGGGGGGAAASAPAAQALKRRKPSSGASPQASRSGEHGRAPRAPRLIGGRAVFCGPGLAAGQRRLGRRLAVAGPHRVRTYTMPLSPLG
jgi:translation initiation factor IF-2